MKSKITEDPIIVMVLLLGFAFLFCAYFYPPPKPDNSGIVIGVITFMSLCLNFKYGSSKGSNNKDITIADALAKKTEAPAPGITTADISVTSTTLPTDKKETP